MQNLKTMVNEVLACKAHQFLLLSSSCSVLAAQFQLLSSSCSFSAAQFSCSVSAAQFQLLCSVKQIWHKEDVLQKQAGLNLDSVYNEYTDCTLTVKR